MLRIYQDFLLWAILNFNRKKYKILPFPFFLLIVFILLVHITTITLLINFRRFRTDFECWTKKTENCCLS